MFIGFKSAIKIMQINPTDATSYGIEKFGRNCFSYRIKALFFPTAYQVKILFGNKAV
jgi:hypothetical protein